MASTVVVALAALTLPASTVTAAQSRHASDAAQQQPSSSWTEYQFESNTTRGATVVRPRALPGGGIEARAVTVRHLIASAYGVRPADVEGGPGWLDSDQVDLVIKTRREVTPDQMAATLRDVLTTRFRLVIYPARVGATPSMTTRLFVVAAMPPK